MSREIPLSAAKNEGPELLEAYDFIVVGGWYIIQCQRNSLTQTLGGTSGLALADRLSESGSQSVLVLEAGPDPHVVKMFQVPGELGHLQGTPLNWNFLTEPQAGLDGRQTPYIRGRGLGGSSNINGMFYGRGSATVYDQWERLGNPGWAWKDVYPEFIRSTHFSGPIQDEYNKEYQTWEPSAYGDGPVQVGYQGYVVPPNPAFIKACTRVGIPIVKDLNSGCGIGVKQGTVAIDQQYRRSSGYSFYERAKGRSNLKVMHESPVQKLLFEQPKGNANPRATAVVFIDHIAGLFRNVSVKKEVIVTLGAIQSPQLLMVSGIGPQKTLEAKGIPTLVTNENVGQHFIDHPFSSIMVKTIPEGSMHQHILNVPDIKTSENEYYSKGTGVYTGVAGATNAFQQYSVEKLRSLKADAVIEAGLTDRATVEILFNAMFFPVGPTPSHNPAPDGSYFSITSSSLVSLSEGYVTIRSALMADAPVVNPNFYSHPTDRIVAINAFRDARKIIASPELAPFTVGPNNGEVSPGPTVDSDDDDAIFEYIKMGTMSNLHGAGTCVMLPRDKGGVVDPRLKVYGVDGLRVADGSIIPVLPDTHTSGPVYMIGERMASFLQEEYGF
ncbi:GMC oxidoreductase [Aspergillus sclerotialis]|uniref:GMC oxidoreductase n=1 Tax=Aspergillus sclerotialis TaxID=2070753 RepID=A0A3A2ZQS7_9EURO|nr:GMC oxidoreductase [Aspergillus sclerotialis]